METPDQRQDRLASVAKNLYERHTHIIATMIGAFTLVLLIAWIFTPQHALTEPTTQALPLPPDTPQVTITDSNTPAKWRSIAVHSGDSLSKIFKAQHLPQDQLQAILSMPNGHSLLTQLRPGDHINVLLDNHNNILEMVYKPNTLSALKITRKQQFFSEKIEHFPIEIHHTYQHGVIKASLFNAGLRANLPTKLIMQLIEIFQWDIDFAKEIRPGDHFSVLYEQKYVNGEPIATGDIIAAEFSNRGKIYSAIRFTDANGDAHYYDRDGHSKKRRFTRTPVKFSRISSYFKPRRWHPVLHRFRKHTGVDYAAPSGTPIKATGHGKIQFIGRKGGYGNAIIIDHGNGYTTLYGHMLRFAKKMHKGTPVKQGQIIGYVGMTGLATGPHCHYEFRINNKHRDPLHVKLPQGHTITQQQRQKFFAKVDTLFKKLALFGQTKITANHLSSHNNKG